jgi:hypothetical protein
MQPEDPRPKIHPACVYSILQLGHKYLGGINVANVECGNDK